MLHFFKNKKLLDRILVDIIFYSFILFGFPAVYIIAFKFKFSIAIMSLIYSMFMITIISLKTMYDTNKIKNIFFKEDK